MPLHLKRTPAEEHERARRKAYKAVRNAAKRRRTGNKNHAGSSRQSDHDTIEEMEFREKMWGALEDDERLDGINARFDDYAHIPDRWSRDAHDAANLQYMDDDEYAEWIREGMWRKKHAREYEEQARRDAERAARSAREKEMRAETSRQVRLAREKGERRKREREKQREEEYRQRYEQRWKVLLDSQTRDLVQEPLTFANVPWPLFLAGWKFNSSNNVSFHVEDITPGAISAFLLLDVNIAKDDDTSRRNRDKLKETLLRFHPDKFEGRFMHLVAASDVENVREAVGQVARVLNVLMSGQSS